MKKYLFNEVCGKRQGKMIIIEAETAEEAFEKSRFTEKIRPYDKFKTIYPLRVYELYEFGKPNKVEYICR